MDRYAAYSDEEKQAKQVREVWQILAPARGYHMSEEVRFRWGIAQKPV
jgi:hypothetical protein